MLPLLTIAAAAHAVPVEMIVTAVGVPADDGTVSVQVTFLNERNAPAELTVPDQVAASLLIGDSITAVSLQRAGVGTGAIAVAPGGFARADYTVRLPDAWGSIGVLTLADGSIGYTVGSKTRTTPPAGNSMTVVVAKPPALPTADRGNSFLGNLSSYEPIYAVYGPGTSTDALIQISFKYQLFGRGGAPADQRRWTDGITFAYTQRMYWDLGAKSAPFRNIDFQPELFYFVPLRHLTGDAAIGGQAGIRHESNGRDGASSRSLNTAYVHSTFALPVGRWTLKLGPQAWAYIGDLSDNPDIARYRGNAGLFAEIGRDDGLRVSTSSRRNFASGQGALNVEASYPLGGLIGSSLISTFSGRASSATVRTCSITTGTRRACGSVWGLSANPKIGCRSSVATARISAKPARTASARAAGRASRRPAPIRAAACDHKPPRPSDRHRRYP